VQTDTQAVDDCLRLQETRRRPRTRDLGVCKQQQGGMAATGVNFVRIEAPGPGSSDGGHHFLRISQVEVFDASGTNVARGRPCSASSFFGDASGNPHNAVDGEARARPHPMEFCSANAHSDWWEVDLGGPVHVDRVVYFNRNDGGPDAIADIVGCTLCLLDASRSVVVTAVFDRSSSSHLKQEFAWGASESRYLPSTRALQDHHKAMVRRVKMGAVSGIAKLDAMSYFDGGGGTER
jgi:F5/8 type C domain